MLHLLSAIFFLALLAASGGLVAVMLGRDWARIVAALERAPGPLAERPWRTRVRPARVAAMAPVRPAGRCAAA